MYLEFCGIVSYPETLYQQWNVAEDNEVAIEVEKTYSPIHSSNEPKSFYLLREGQKEVVYQDGCISRESLAKDWAVEVKFKLTGSY